MDYITMFPSYGRANKLSTLKFCPPAATVVAVDGDTDGDIDERYRAALPPITTMLVVRPGTIGYIRHQMIDFAQSGQGLRWLFMLDDDHTGMYKRSGVTEGGYPKLVKCEWEEVYTKMMEYARYNNVQMLGLSQRQSNHNYTEQAFHGPCKISDFYLLDLHWLKARGINYDSRFTHFEDFQLTLEILRNGGRAGLYLPYAFEHETMGSNAGGFQSSGRNRAAMAHESLRMLMAKYPKYVQAREGRLFVEPKVDWAALRTGWK
jgi:hypothetical protein